jgi:hypothetical protein
MVKLQKTKKEPKKYNLQLASPGKAVLAIACGARKLVAACRVFFTVEACKSFSMCLQLPRLHFAVTECLIAIL